VRALYKSISNYAVDIKFDGSSFISFRDFLFSIDNFSFVIELPFLKFIRYIFTEKSFREKAVKKL
jgi:hypothetical protein